MKPIPNQQSRIPQRAAATRRAITPRPEQGTNWLLWSLVALALATALAMIVWRLDVREQQRTTEKEVSALLESADQLIQENREDEAEAAMNKALTMIPGDVRCRAVIDRINTKRKMIHEKMASASEFALAQAEQIALGNIAGAIEAFGRIRLDNSLTPEAKKIAEERAKALKGEVCTLQLPADWPTDAVLSIDGVLKFTGKTIVTGIAPGKRMIHITRFGFREPDDMELEFLGLETLQLPTILWRPRGTKVSIMSRPAGAAVWRDGKDTGKITPCVIEDVENGQVEFILKHPKHANTPLSGEVKDRQPLKLSSTLDPLE